MADENGDQTLQNKIALFTLRASEYRDRYESMRSLEWKVLIQAYVGYAAIGIGFWHVADHPHADWRMSTFAMIATFLFFLATQYLCFRIQERLIAFDKTYENWIKQIYGLVGVNPDNDPGPGTRELGHQYFWTYDTQLFLGLLTLAGLLCYEANLGFDKYQPMGCLLAALIVLAIIYALVLLIVTYPKRPNASHRSTGKKA